MKVRWAGASGHDFLTPEHDLESKEKPTSNQYPTPTQYLSCFEDRCRSATRERAHSPWRSAHRKTAQMILFARVHNDHSPKRFAPKHLVPRPSLPPNATCTNPKGRSPPSSKLQMQLRMSQQLSYAPTAPPSPPGFSAGRRGSPEDPHRLHLQGTHPGE